MQAWLESSEAIGAVDTLLASVGLGHGRRATRTGAWKGGERVRAPKASEGKAPRSRTAVGIERVPGWEEYSWLHAGFSTRLGGRSQTYGDGDLNLGWTEADPADVVAANRKRFLKAVAGKSKMQLATLRQTHSGLIRHIFPCHGPLATAEGKATLRGDAAVTAVPDILLGIQTADCVPILLADTRTHAVAAFHAGWRGTLKRIVERGIGTMQLEYGSRPKDLVAAIGPAIGACCFAVGEEVRFEFDSQFAYTPQLFTEVYDSDPIRDKYPLLFLTARAPGHSNIGPQIHLDLVEANRRQLLDSGLSAKKISVIGECTACTRLKNGQLKYFSHRGEHGFTGRMLSVIGAAKK